MGIQVVCETCSYKKVAPILLGELNSFFVSSNIAYAQLQRRKADSLELELITLFTKREVVAALMQQKFADLAPQMKWEQHGNVLFSLLA